MKTTEIRYASADGASTIHALCWEPDSLEGDPRGIIQFIHGMSEYIERYAGYADFLTSQGFVACAEDHIGHGHSVACADDLGHIPLAAGKRVLVEDVHALRLNMQERFGASVPYVVFGHSMGSFIARSYITVHGEGLSAAIICGTGQTPLAMSKAGNRLARIIAKVKGERHRSNLLHGMADGAYSKAIEGARTPLDWLSVDEAVVDAYIADPLCGQMFTAAGYAALTDLTGEVADPASAAKVPKDLPLFFIAGALDPVGDNGKGVIAAAYEYRDAGVGTVDMKLYPGMRHEIHNEPDRLSTYQDVVDWLAAQGI